MKIKGTTIGVKEEMDEKDRKGRILFVDDDEISRRSLSLILGKNGYEAETAATGREALEKAEQGYYNLVLLDIKLPDVEGIELLAPLKEMHPDTAVIMITGYASVETAVQALSRGAFAYIAKPLNMHEVLATVREALEKQSLVEENRQKADRLALIAELAKLIGSSLDINDVYEAFAAGLRRLVDFEQVTIALVEEGNIRFLAVSSSVDTEFIAGSTMALTGTPTEWVMEKRRTNIEGDLAQERQFPIDDVHFEEGLRAAIRLPLFSRGEVFGTFNLTSRHPHAYGKREQEILEELTGQIAVAIENDRLFTELKGRQEELEMAYHQLAGKAEALAKSKHELENAYLKLQESGKNFREVIMNSADGIVIVSTDGILHFINPAAESLFGRKSDELVDTPFGFPIVAGDTTELDIVRRDGIVDLAEMRVVKAEWYGESVYLASLRDITDRKRAEEEVKRHARRMEALYAVTQAVSQHQDMDKILKDALDRVCEVMDTDVGGIYLLDLQAGELIIKAHNGMSKDFISSVGLIKLDEKEIKRGLELQEPVFKLDKVLTEDNVARIAAAGEKEGLRAQVTVPLWSRGMPLGALVVADHLERHFSTDELGLLTAIGNEIAVGIENAMLLERTKELSLTDALTGLFNRRHFYQMLESEQSRTQRYGRSFALVMLDLDEFKEYNDRFGHTLGDGVLQSFAQTLKATLRKSDAAFRYGGDEFTIILPDTDTNRARQIIDRVRSKWSRTHEAQHPALETPLGFSAGIAQFPQDAETTDGLVFLADSALYFAKREGGYRDVLVSDLSAIPPDVLSKATLDQVYALAATVDARDPYTYGHSGRVAKIAQTIGKAIRLPEKELADLYAASLLHDVGKVGVPDAIMAKPDLLTAEEWEIIKRHSAEGARIVGYVRGLGALVPVIRHHHEWYDGTGYPDGLKGEEIPLARRRSSRP